MQKKQSINKSERILRNKKRIIDLLEDQVGIVENEIS